MNDKEKNDISPQDSSDADDLDNLSDEEKAAFEKIMAEISVTTPDAAPASLPDEKQKKESAQPVMASSGPNDSETETPTDQATEDEDLDDDQLDALNKIMAEIETKRKGEPAETPTERELKVENGEESEEELSEDQQDVLNQIMSEINSKRKTDEVETVDKGENSQEDSLDESEDGALAADQQAALDNIMADIESKKKARDVSKDGDISQDSEKKSDEKDEQELSMDEFSSELDLLLSSNSDVSTDTSQIDDKIDKNGQAGPTPKPAGDNKPDTPKATEKGSKSAVQKIQDLKLHEIELDTEKTQKTKKTKKKTAKGHIGSKATRWAIRVSIIVLAPVCLVTMALGGYFGLQKMRQWQENKTNVITHQVTSDGSPTALGDVRELQAPSTKDVSKIETTDTKSKKNPPTELFEVTSEKSYTETIWRDDLQKAQLEIQSKISEIQTLKDYYHAEIDQDITKIAPGSAQTALSLDKALTDKNNELRIRSVQRRINYIAKLEVPLLELGAISEKIRYLERSCQLHDTLSKGISGLSKNELQRQVTSSLLDYQQYTDQLSIDDIQVRQTDLDGTWKFIKSKIQEKNAKKTQNSPKNKAISNEICNGNYDRKFMLTELSEDTAQCLVKWSGKDLYLNGLTELRPEVAKILGQWPGEWLSLNGLKTLSSETAIYLASWSGKRLSLNGLTTLSPSATKNLSNWQGEQLELIGLQSIGPWENYKTKLFLSESLKRRLEVQ